ncbi:hypothetical protein BDD12DRAFT_545964 [Trichophaea hybrida]|nr:hypothetical protein BDD12DRAFT_545964 [Trichophaea hybrida]
MGVYVLLHTYRTSLDLNGYMGDRWGLYFIVKKSEEKFFSLQPDLQFGPRDQRISNPRLSPPLFSCTPESRQGTCPTETKPPNSPTPADIPRLFIYRNLMQVIVHDPRTVISQKQSNTITEKGRITSSTPSSCQVRAKFIRYLFLPVVMYTYGCLDPACKELCLVRARKNKNKVAITGWVVRKRLCS